MSLIPFLFDYDPWELRRHHPHRHCYRSPWDQFGIGLSPTEVQLLAIPASLLNSDDNQLANRREDLPTPTVGKDGFQVHMDVQQFKPSEVSVKTVDDFVVVEGKHEDRQDEHGYISRHFVRKYKLPKGYDVNHVTSSLSSDGVLTIKAPPPTKTVEGKERVVQIQQTGPAHLNIKENKVEDKDKDKEKEK